MKHGISAGIDAEGRLVISADADARELLSGLPYYDAEALVVEALREGESLDFVQPEWVGAMTDSPIFTDGLDYPDVGEPRLLPESRVWWFPNYMVIDPWQELAESGFVRFDAAPEERTSVT